MRIIFLGTSSAAPTAERGLSSIALVRDGELLLFDAGEGMQRNYIKAGLGMNKKMKIFISHMHADHCVGLLGLLQTMALQGREKPVDLYGEPKVKEFWETNKRIINFHLSFPVNVHEIITQGTVVKEEEYKVTCCKARHSVPSLAYCIEEFDRPGLFNIAKAKKMGIPEGDLYSKLQHGKDITYKGKKIKSNVLVGPPRRGRKVGISGDTRPTNKLIKFFHNCDILIFESTYSHDKLQKAIENWHSTAVEAATIAKKSRTRKLFLTHFSARYDETYSLVKEAQTIHSDVQAAEDLKEVEVYYT